MNGLNAGLTTIHEDEIAKHLAMAQGLVTRAVVLDHGDGQGASLAGTGRRFVPTVTTGSVKRTREVELSKTVQSVRVSDPMLSPQQHAVLYRARRGAQVALAVSEVFARQTHLEQLQARNLS